jgi:hypothetical protein
MFPSIIHPLISELQPISLTHPQHPHLWNHRWLPRAQCTNPSSLHVTPNGPLPQWSPILPSTPSLSLCSSHTFSVQMCATEGPRGHCAFVVSASHGSCWLLRMHQSEEKKKKQKPDSHCFKQKRNSLTFAMGKSRFDSAQQGLGCQNLWPTLSSIFFCPP